MTGVVRGSLLSATTFWCAVAAGVAFLGAPMPVAADDASRPRPGRPAAARARMRGLSPASIRQVVLRNLGQVVHCHEDALRRTPEFSGRFVVRFVIGPGGQVTRAEIAEATRADAEIGLCLMAAVQHWRFPAPEGRGSVTVNYPFNLLPPE